MKRLLAMLTLVLSPAAMAADIEEPQWELIDKLDAVELRLYQPSIQAVTELRSKCRHLGGFPAAGRVYLWRGMNRRSLLP